MTPRSRHGLRTGFSLSELLVASAIALVVMGAVATLFGVFSGALSRSQGTLDLTSRMRTAAWQLRQDLAGITLEVIPTVNPEGDDGYFSLLEGPARDSSAAANTSTLTADCDDALQFTTRAIPGPFAARFNADTVEAPCAEVAWWVIAAANQPVAGVTLYELCRRQMLVVDYIGKDPFQAGGNSLAGAAVASAQQFYDISMRTEGGKLVPNTLGDLGRRENRFVSSTSGQATAVATVSNGVVTAVTLISPGWGYTNATPILVTFSGGAGTGAEATATANTNGRVTVTLSKGGSGYTSAPSVTISPPPVGGASLRNTVRDGEDVMLTNVISFDVRVFDPQARSQVSGTIVRYPGDPNYVAPATGPSGAYVDLGAGQAAGPLSAAMNAQHPPLASGHATYDTWTTAYEFNGPGTNGLDDNGDGLPDDVGEWTKPPPYNVPLRGVEVRIRCFEPASGQIRQMTVRQTFQSR